MVSSSCIHSLHYYFLCLMFLVITPLFPVFSGRVCGSGYQSVCVYWFLNCCFPPQNMEPVYVHSTAWCLTDQAIALQPSYSSKRQRIELVLVFRIVSRVLVFCFPLWQKFVKNKSNALEFLKTAIFLPLYC